MRKTIKQLEAELALAKQEAAQWKEAHKQLADAMSKQPAWYPYWPYTYTTDTVNLPYVSTPGVTYSQPTWTTTTNGVDLAPVTINLGSTKVSQ